MGLTKQEVEQRIAEGKVNKEIKSRGKSEKEILLSNTINYFNLLNIVLAGIILLSGQIKNVLFLGIIVVNTMIAIYQEIRSKRMIDKLTLLSKNKVYVIRDDKEVFIDDNQIVVDDIIIVNTGDQIAVDTRLVEGHLEMDESNLTGESDSVDKSNGSVVYSGSVVVSGTAKLKVEKVGAESYLNKISLEAKADKRYPSKLRDTMNKILKIVTVAILPVGILLFLKNNFIFKLPFEDVILKSAAPLIGMIPEGLILLTSVALAVSVYNLGKKKVLVQELHCIETLARVDVLCVDKTGTITTGEMEVVEVIGDIKEIMPSYLGAFDYENASDKALIKHFGKNSDFEILEKVDFSSKRKYSSVTFKEKGSYALGAYEFLITNGTKEEQEIIDKYAKQGYRVLVLSKSEKVIKSDDLPQDLKVIGYVIISDVIRENTKDIFEFFRGEGVKVKIISGDNPVAVGAIAAKAGLLDVATIDVSKLSDDEIKEAVLNYNVFGRVSPHQKKLMVETLQANNNTVAMTGDGVNDILALKQADVSLAMAQGCDATKQISNIVLLENNFANLYDILMEGRRVINNIQKVATLFLSKTAMSILFAVASLLTPFAFPFIPIQMSLVSTLTIGIPGFLLTMETSKQKIKSNFMRDVLLKAGVTATIFFVTVLALNLFSHYTNQSSHSLLTTYSTYLALINGIVLIVLISKPLNHYKVILVSVIAISVAGILLVAPDFFHLLKMREINWSYMAIFAGFMITAMHIAFGTISLASVKKVKAVNNTKS